MKSSTAEKATQIAEIVKVAAIGGALMYGYFGKTAGESLRTLETAQNITITIENLTVNL